MTRFALFRFGSQLRSVFVLSRVISMPDNGSPYLRVSSACQVSSLRWCHLIGDEPRGQQRTCSSGWEEQGIWHKAKQRRSNAESYRVTIPYHTLSLLAMQESSAERSLYICTKAQPPSKVKINAMGRILLATMHKRDYCTLYSIKHNILSIELPGIIREVLEYCWVGAHSTVVLVAIYYFCKHMS